MAKGICLQGLCFDEVHNFFGSNVCLTASISWVQGSLDGAMLRFRPQNHINYANLTLELHN